MTENQSAYSDTIGVKLDDLKAMRNTFNNLTAANVLRSTKACIAWLDTEIAKGEPRASCANENDKPRHVGLTPGQPECMTVKGETMSAQTERMLATSCSFIGGVTQNGLKTLTPEHAAEVAARTPLKFKPVLNNLSERKHSHYFKKCPYDVVDVYRVLAMFGVTDPCFQHALKKILLSGDRKHKDVEKDVQESIDTLMRWQEMREEDVTAGLALLELQKA
jgi:hypothetical protein